MSTYRSVTVTSAATAASTATAAANAATTATTTDSSTFTARAAILLFPDEPLNLWSHQHQLLERRHGVCGGGALPLLSLARAAASATAAAAIDDNDTVVLPTSPRRR
jgi:hypothetical protein